MNEGLLFDTSVWIDFFLGRNSEEVRLLTSYLLDDKPIFTCPVIVQEILQGINSDLQFRKVKESFLALPILTGDPVEAALGAAEFYRKLRKKGITIRKSNDCLIAWYALKNSIEVVHCDRDFDLIFENL
ncbi:MAG: type II toxin-antitoxin system VapC family toxin [Mariniphaga sp.]